MEKEGSENIQKEEVKEIQNTNKEIDTKNPKKMKNRTLIVLAIIAIFALVMSIMYRADYIETLEIGEQYISAFAQNVRYKVNIGVINFIFVFLIVYMTNRLIKKGVKQFFDEEKKEMPKLPNKSIALVIALVTSLVVSNMFLEKVIMFVNTAQFGVTDPVFNMDVGFYMFQGPLIRTTFILWCYTSNTSYSLCCSILHYCI